MMKKKVLLFTCLAAFGLSMAVTGCSKEEPAKKSEIQEEKKEEKLEVIGVEKDSEDCLWQLPVVLRKNRLRSLKYRKRKKRKS